MEFDFRFSSPSAPQKGGSQCFYARHKQAKKALVLLRLCVPCSRFVCLIFSPVQLVVVFEVRVVVTPQTFVSYEHLHSYVLKYFRSVFRRTLSDFCELCPRPALPATKFSCFKYVCNAHERANSMTDDEISCIYVPMLPVSWARGSKVQRGYRRHSEVAKFLLSFACF